MLKRRILETLASAPGISIGDLKAALPDVKVRTLHAALDALRKAGAIEATSYAHYAILKRRPSSAGQGQTAPMARLMAGR